MLRLPDHWVWDSWLAAGDGGEHHLFFLRASRALLDPDRRHDRTAVGHAVSTDLREWTLLPDALVHSDGPAWDDFAIWTGSVVRADDGSWWMFYTGRSRAERGRVQRIGAARSDDLITWRRDPGVAVLEADPRWYQKLDPAVWPHEAWRDPYVVRDPGGDGWHMLITARARAGGGVIGHARSADLASWEIGPPLTAPAGFGHMEVPRVATIDGCHVLLFSCQPALVAGRPAPGGVWVAPGESLLGPWDLAQAAPLEHPSLYAANLVEGPDGWAVLGFRDTEDGEFVGEIADPIPLEVAGATVRLAAVARP